MKKSSFSGSRSWQFLVMSTLGRSAACRSAAVMFSKKTSWICMAMMTVPMIRGKPDSVRSFRTCLNSARLPTSQAYDLAFTPCSFNSLSKA